MLTLRLSEGGGTPERIAAEAAARGAGASISWHDDETANLHYGRCTLDAPLALPPHLTVYEGPFIALAVTPSPPEAFPHLLDALGGPGRPSGVYCAFRSGDGVVVEFDWTRTPALTVLDIVDVELRRLGGTRTTRLLTPLSPEAAAAIAADGLATPEITVDRVLESLLERAGVAD